MFQRILDRVFSAASGGLAESISNRKRANEAGPWHCEIEFLFCALHPEPGRTGRWHFTVNARSDDPEAGGFSMGTPYVRVYSSPYFDTEAQTSAFLVFQLDKARRVHPDSNFYRWVEPPPPRPEGIVYRSLNEAMGGRIEKYESGKWVLDTTDYLRMRFD
jgi:hypothetical protein